VMWSVWRDGCEGGEYVANLSVLGGGGVADTLADRRWMLRRGWIG
jgi:hypothetical protein